jgi:hypothetical protein
MSELVAPAQVRRETSRVRRRRDDLLIGLTALIAAMLSLPLAQSSWNGPEVAAVLAIASTAMLAGHRWAIAVLVIAELMLIPTAWPRVLGGDPVVRLAAAGTLIAMLPGLFAMRRAAAALVLVTGWKRTRATCRRFHLALIAIGIIAASLPIV